MTTGPSHQIIKHLEAITRKGYRPQQVFDDWLHLMVYALMRDDTQYIKVMKRYRNDGPTENVERNGVKIITGEREADHFAAAFGALMNEMAIAQRELLGEVYEAWELQNKYSGQFFTPWSVCELMAGVTGAPEPGQTVNDPCSGSGRLLIATAKITSARALDTITFIAQDIDETCVMMTVLNFVFFNLNGYVYLGNSLALDVHRAFKTTRSALGGSVIEIQPPVVTQSPVEHIVVERKTVQMSTKKKQLENSEGEPDQQVLF